MSIFLVDEFERYCARLFHRQVFLSDDIFTLIDPRLHSCRRRYQARYFSTLDVISEVICVVQKRRPRFENQRSHLSQHAIANF